MFALFSVFTLEKFLIGAVVFSLSVGDNHMLNGETILIAPLDKKLLSFFFVLSMKESFLTSFSSPNVVNIDINWFFFLNFH